MTVLRGVVVALLLALPSQAFARKVPTLEGAPAIPPVLKRLGHDGKPVIVHFFAMWCAACVTEMPLVRRALLEAERRGAHVVLLSLDEPESASSKLPAFLARTRLEFTTYLLHAPDPEPVTKLFDPLWMGDLPATFVFKGGLREKSFLQPLKSEDELLMVL